MLAREIGDRDAGQAEDRVDAVELERVDDELEAVGFLRLRSVSPPRRLACVGGRWRPRLGGYVIHVIPPSRAGGHPRARPASCRGGGNAARVDAREPCGRRRPPAANAGNPPKGAACLASFDIRRNVCGISADVNRHVSHATSPADRSHAPSPWTPSTGGAAAAFADRRQRQPARPGLAALKQMITEADIYAQPKRSGSTRSSSRRRSASPARPSARR